MIRFFSLVILWIWLVLPVKAGNVVFRHLNTSDGLSHYSVMALYQDEKGLIWIGTRNGVSVYDGGSVQTYKHLPLDSTSIHNSYIRDITGNRKGLIYFLTNRGVSVFDTKSEAFKTVFEGYAEDICFYDGRLYLASENQVLAYDSDKKGWNTFYKLPDDRLCISRLLITDDELYLGTEGNGLLIYDRQKETLSHPIEKGKVSDVFEDSKKRFWVGTWEHGAYVIQSGQITNYRHLSKDNKTLCADFVRKFCEDNQGNIWIGTLDGLNKYVEASGNFERFQADMKTHLSHSSIWSIMCDSQGTLWVGTYFGGVNYFNAFQTVCQHYMADEEMNGPLVVGTMVEDNDKMLWICTEGNGLCKLDPKTGVTRWYKHVKDDPYTISHNNLKSIYYDKRKNVLWIGTHLGGLNCFDLETERFTHYVCNIKDGSFYKSNIICDIVPYQEDLLLATHDGVYRFKPTDGTFHPMFNTGKEGAVIGLALDLHLDTRGLLWIAGTDKGVYAYDFQNDKLISYRPNLEKANALSSNGVNCLYEDSEHRLWLCMAESGVDLYRRETADFENYDNLLSSCVYGAYEVGKNKLLFITDNGFSYFDYTNKQIRNFGTHTSLPLSGINQKSIYRASNGLIYIGGVDGLISFIPEDLELMTSTYQIFPSKLFVNDQEIHVGDETGILQSALPYTPKITLNHRQNMFSVTYSITNYVPLVREDVMYKIENLSDNWTNFRDGKMITCTNLDPGLYTLVVKSSEESGQQASVSRLEIEILPPWYCTTVAYVCYCIILMIILYVVVYFYKHRVKLQAELEYERKHIKDVESLNQYKLRFFTNISHEFRTPLTIIIGQIELLLQMKSFMPTVYNRILNVYKSSLQLQSLITELLDFRKQEQGHMKIKVSPHDMVAFLEENYLLFREYAKTRDVDFEFVAPSNSIEVWYDSKQMQKVVNNLLSNAFQYTPKGGKITLQIEQETDRVVISVADTGKGIRKNEIEYIFNRFYQTDATIISSTKGTGIGLALTKGIIELHKGLISVESEEGKGSVFTFFLPLGKAHFHSDEIIEDNSSVISSVSEDSTYVDLNNEEDCALSESEAETKLFKILIVEDDDDLKNMLVDVFKPYYIVEQASDGMEGWNKVCSWHPDIVLSDVLMPTMSGVELCKRIKNQVSTCHIPVVLLTARAAVEHKLEGLLFGADDYIVKPFDVNILLARCRNLVNGRIVLQEKFSKQPQVAPQLFATNSLDKEFMDKVMGVIEKNMDNPEFNVILFAKEMGIARTKLFVRLKSITGQTPNEFIMTVRMKKAAYLLKNHQELNIAEISDRVGFNSSRYFCRVFKEKYNLTPQVYRSEKEEKVELSEEK